MRRYKETYNLEYMANDFIWRNLAVFLKDLPSWWGDFS